MKAFSTFDCCTEGNIFSVRSFLAHDLVHLHLQQENIKIVRTLLAVGEKLGLDESQASGFGLVRKMRECLVGQKMTEVLAHSVRQRDGRTSDRDSCSVCDANRELDHHQLTHQILSEF
jgi:hypothetical protein